MARVVPRHACSNDFAADLRARGTTDARSATAARRDWLTGMLELAWDGDWYRRAYFDDGTPLGSAQNDECRIDSLTQSWAVFSGAAQPRRAARAMDAVRAHLVRRDAQLVLLLTPPFDRIAHDPGYIKGYLPGIRENGGQYTHAAFWTVIALARLGLGDEAMELFHMINPINHTRTPEALEQLPGRAVRRRRGCLRPPDARRPRRLDVVHGFGRLDVSGGDRRSARSPSPRLDLQIDSDDPGDVAGVLDRLDVDGTTYRIAVVRIRTIDAGRAVGGARRRRR